MWPESERAKAWKQREILLESSFVEPDQIYLESVKTFFSGDLRQPGFSKANQFPLGSQHDGGYGHPQAKVRMSLNNDKV